MKNAISLLLISFLVACGGGAPDNGESAAIDAADPHSFGNPHQVRVTHVALDLDVEFERQSLQGSATLDLVRGDAATDRLVLDTRNLDVAAVYDVSGTDRVPLEFALGEAAPDLGAPLTVTLDADTERVRVEYATDPGASALQWLTPRQTLGGEHPFLFSQGQAIHTRSWIPLQDSPGVRVTYEAVLRVPEGLRAVMSAENDPHALLDGEFRFTMPEAVPPYLIALAVGDLAFVPMSERTGVYAEPGIVEAAAAEFTDTERMMEVTEALYGPYRWGRYDLLVLPPSFPFGGMENPRLSFITPTIIAGDRSLVSLIAHELAHSWSGNLVSNSTWRDLWLNEGFTTYVTNRIMEEVFGERRARMEATLDYDDLVAELETLAPGAQVLAVDLAGEHADAVFTGIPYDKGMLFLKWLEHAFGRTTFDAFLRDYFDHFAFESITTAQFEAYLERNLLATKPGVVTMTQVREWIHAPGLPETLVVPESPAFAEVDAQRAEWMAGEAGANGIATAGWTVHEWRHFLNGLPRAMETARLAELDDAFRLTSSTNYMILRDWMSLVIRNRYEPGYARLEALLQETGRNLLVKPLYEALMETGQSEFARRVYEAALPGYHPITVAAIEPVVHPD